MEQEYAIPLEKVRAEVEHLRSRFIATLAPVSSTDEARVFIKEIRAEFPDASHNVPAYIIGGDKNCIDYFSDDGEPSGTSGRPVHTVLKGSGLGDVALVVTRYFGGTLLGTGGLVKAYTDAAQTVIKLVTKAKRIQVTVGRIQVQYPLYEKVKHVIEKNMGEVISEEFTDSVTIIIQASSSDFTNLTMLIMDISAGKAVISTQGYQQRLVRL